MNDIFNENVPLKTETPAFAKHVLPAVPSSEVYLEDCVTALKRYADNHFDLAIVDPPYGNIDAIGLIDNKKKGKQATKRTNYKLFENIAPDDEYYCELARVSKNQIIWGGNFLGLCGGVIVWQKNGTAFGEAEVAICSTHKSVKVFEYTWNGMIQQNMKDKEIRIHPTQKPVALYEWILANYAKPNDLILDTHLGSGSSRIAAYKGGFNFVGFEIDQEYYEKQEKRFNDFKSQLRLF
jgi:site-specific DNA-methyltransferase (adenine-specific)